METIEHHIEDIKNIREELSWRVKIAYTSNVAFYTIILFVLGALLQEKTQISLIELKKSNIDLYVGIFSTIVILLAVFATTLTANHMVEKKIELYILQIQKKILKKSPDEKIEIPKFSWISFLYANEHEGYLKTKKKSRKWYYGALSIHPALQYGLPNLLPLFILIHTCFSFCPLVWFMKIYYVIAGLIWAASCFQVIMFFKYFNKMSAEHREFFEKHVDPYFKSNPQKEENMKNNKRIFKGIRYGSVILKITKYLLKKKQHEK